MKYAILGSAPSSLQLAPFNDPSWKILGCSPGVYPYATRVHGWFELHRWEPGEVGKPNTQKPWFSPEYVAWMRGLPPHANLWMAQHNPDMPNSKALPIHSLINKFGSYFFTSSIAIMMACAIDDILENRRARQMDAPLAKAFEEDGGPTDQAEPDIIGLWGIDMAATEEYGYQRAGCQHFCQLATTLGIQIYTPPESDVLRPMPIYGIEESSHWHIKNTARLRELQGRLAGAQQAITNATGEMHFLRGAIDDLQYQMQTWGGDRDGIGTDPSIYAQSPEIRDLVAKTMAPKPPQPILLGELGPNGEIPGAKRIDDVRDALTQQQKAMHNAIAHEQAQRRELRNNRRRALRAKAKKKGRK